MKYLEDLIFWINERERIRIKKEAGEPKPWTQDLILQHYRFCNVRREDDRVTKWVHNNWLKPHLGEPSVAFAMGVARMVNWPDTLADLGYPEPWDRRHFERVLGDRAARGAKVWTSAYMITGGYSPGGEPKERIIGRVLDGLHEQLIRHPLHEGDTLDIIHDAVMVPGIGQFLGAQIVADVKWDPKHRATDDWWTWCAPGPGSMMGLNFLLEKDTAKNWANGEFIREVNNLRQIIQAETAQLLDAQNTQNCLCEFSKYVRAKHFGKRLKSAYTPYGG